MFFTCTWSKDEAGAWGIEALAKSALAKLGLTDLSAKMQTLSGGRRKRVALAHALVVPSELLILDEPTNHLDAESTNWLEEYLRKFSGAILLVTHDRYFLDRTVNHLFRFESGVLQHYSGSYTDFLEQKIEQEKQAPVQASSPKSNRNSEPKLQADGARKLTGKEKKELEALEWRIAKAETRKAELAERLNELAADYEKAKPVYAELDAIAKQLDADMNRWAELAEWA
ncbi:MAG: ATP-binding cassette domain-containing protein [Chlorobiales bacterium]